MYYRTVAPPGDEKNINSRFCVYCRLANIEKCFRGTTHVKRGTVFRQKRDEWQICQHCDFLRDATMSENKSGTKIRAISEGNRTGPKSDSMHSTQTPGKNSVQFFSAFVQNSRTFP